MANSDLVVSGFLERRFRWKQLVQNRHRRQLSQQPPTVYSEAAKKTVINDNTILVQASAGIFFSKNKYLFVSHYLR